MSYLNEIQNREMDEDEGHCIAHALSIEYGDYLKLKYNLEHIPTEDGFTAGYLLNILNGDAHPEIVNKITGLQPDNSVLLPASIFDEFNDYNEEYDAILNSPEVYTNFTREILSVQDLNALEVGRLDSVFKRQLFISLIGTLETFLSTTFIKLISENQLYFRNFVETFPEFKERKFSLSSIYIEQENLKSTVEKVSLDIIYHHLHKVRLMYQGTFGIQFPEISELSKAITKRHDLVHRNGSTKKGESIIITGEDINELIRTIVLFVEDICLKLKLDAFRI